MFLAPFYSHSLSRPLYVEERFFENISSTSFLGSVRTFLSEKNYISAPCVLTQQKTQIVLPDNHVINLPPIWVIIIHYYPALSINLQYGWLLSIIIHHPPIWVIIHFGWQLWQIVLVVVISPILQMAHFFWKSIIFVLARERKNVFTQLKCLWQKILCVSHSQNQSF